VLLDGAIPVVWLPAPARAGRPCRAAPLSLEPALEREFEERVADWSTLAFRVALGVLRRREDAEDVAQDAFLRAHRSFASLRDRDRFRAWLVRTAFRLALDRLRGEKRRARREDAAAMAAPAHAESVEDAAARAELSARVGEAVDALPEKLRIVTVLAAIQEQDVASVARLLELPEGTVKSRLFLARKALAEKLRCLASVTTTR
jgi:RNA polymerase sigma-70 factor (ECF subfamily)